MITDIKYAICVTFAQSFETPVVWVSLAVLILFTLCCLSWSLHVLPCICSSRWEISVKAMFPFFFFLFLQELSTRAVILYAHSCRGFAGNSGNVALACEIAERLKLDACAAVVEKRTAFPKNEQAQSRAKYAASEFRSVRKYA